MDRVDETVLNYDLIEDVVAALVGSDDCLFKSTEGDGPSRGAILVFLTWCSRANAKVVYVLGRTVRPPIFPTYELALFFIDKATGWTSWKGTAWRLPQIIFVED